MTCKLRIDHQKINLNFVHSVERIYPNESNKFNHKSCNAFILEIKGHSYQKSTYSTNYHPINHKDRFIVNYDNNIRNHKKYLKNNFLQLIYQP
jgi:hypothetical protein